MSQVTSQIESYLDDNAQRFVDDLCQWLRMPSISTDSAYASDVKAAAQWLVDRLARTGFAVELIETDGHPIVYAESPAVAGAPTVLVYGHYDVQPPDPLNEWITPPFEPDVRDGKVFARGATDDKGQFLTHVCSCEAWMKTEGQLPLQIKMLVEGEEESGSHALYKFLAGKFNGDGPSVQERLSADICVISDASQYAPGQPAITYGLKGIAYFELRLQGPKQDLHSGTFGGAVTNPANALCHMLSALIDQDGRIQVGGFYDDVIDMTERERQEFADLEFDDEEFKRQLQVSGLTGEVGYTTLERRWARPTFDINGLWSGYQGEGAKTVLPARAGAKFSFRLVPDQDPAQIKSALEEKLRELCPAGIEMELTQVHAAPGIVVPLESSFMDAAARAVERGFEKRPVFIRCGGSIPIVGAFKDQLGLDTLLLGWGQDDDNTHSPNEKFSIADFHRGIRASAFLWEELAAVATSKPTT